MRRNVIRGEHIFTVDDVLSTEECDRYIAQTEDMGYVSAPITTSRGPVHSPSVRNNTRVMFDSPENAAFLWDRVSDLFEGRSGAPAIGLNERLRFYRYDRGQRFAAHFDGAYRRSLDEMSLYTFMVYLNDNFSGGTTKFLTTGEEIVPKKGSALFFVHRQLHTGTIVTAGRKYVLRSDVMFDVSI